MKKATKTMRAGNTVVVLARRSPFTPWLSPANVLAPETHQKQRFVVRHGLKVVKEGNYDRGIGPARCPLHSIAFQGLHLVRKLVGLCEGSLAKDQIGYPAVVF